MKKTGRDNQLLNAGFYILGVVLFVGFFIVTVWGEDGLLRLMELRAMRDKMVKSNQHLLQSNFQAMEKILKLRQMGYVEQTARTEMGLIRSDEIVYVVTP